MRILPVILSGGAGTRLWPVSRADNPKQFQELHGEGTLLQQALGRLPAQEGIEPPIVICNASQRFVVAEQLREAGIAAARIVLEPVGRSTAPALAIAALLAEAPEDTVLVAMPADHYIADIAAFQAAVREAALLALSGRLMTLGIRPQSAHTGFGYIQLGAPLAGISGAHAIARFKEKPDQATAVAYLVDGDYFWNSGIFIFRADQYLAEHATHHPEIVAACRASLALGRQDADFLRLDDVSFRTSPNLSVDYAIMEKVKNAGILPVDFGWDDIGSWASLWSLGDKDPAGNVVSGNVMLRDVKDSYIQCGDRLVAVAGTHVADIAQPSTVPDASEQRAET